MDVQKVVSRIEGEVSSFRADFREEIRSVRQDMRSTLGRGEFWGGVFAIATLAFTIGGLYWLAVSAQRLTDSNLRFPTRKRE